MQRSVLTHLALDVTEPATLVLEIAVAQAYLDAGVASERLVFAGEDGPLAPTELVTPHGTRVHVLEAPAGSLFVSRPGEIAPAAAHGFYTYDAKYVDADGAELRAVVGEGARILVKVLVRAELQAIDEDAGDHGVAVRARLFHQGDVPSVQVAHGRDEDDTAAVSQGGAQIGDCCVNLHGFSKRFSIKLGGQ